ncbi:MAG: lamin tail domain-containing protein [Lachnospiraceae bacterium]|nr:lamin tail domain-containing protein [Lachnospiraceae bacterium]
MNKRHLQKIVPLFVFLVLAAAGCSNRWKDPKVVINEIYRCSFYVERNDIRRYSDCIELYNPGKTSVSLNGCFLTDDEKNPQKYSLEGLIVPAGGYTLVWLDQNTGLRLSGEEDQLFLADAGEGDFLDHVILPRLNRGASYGRVKDGGARWTVMTATLGSANQEAVSR